MSFTGQAVTEPDFILPEDYIFDDLLKATGWTEPELHERLTLSGAKLIRPEGETIPNGCKSYYEFTLLCLRLHDRINIPAEQVRTILDNGHATPRKLRAALLTVEETPRLGHNAKQKKAIHFLNAAKINFEKPKKTPKAGRGQTTSGPTASSVLRKLLRKIRKPVFKSNLIAFATHEPTAFMIAYSFYEKDAIAISLLCHDNHKKPENDTDYADQRQRFIAKCKSHPDAIRFLNRIDNGAAFLYSNALSEKWEALAKYLALDKRTREALENALEKKGSSGFDLHLLYQEPNIADPTIGSPLAKLLLKIDEPAFRSNLITFAIKEPTAFKIAYGYYEQGIVNMSLLCHDNHKKPGNDTDYADQRQRFIARCNSHPEAVTLLNRIEHGVTLLYSKAQNKDWERLAEYLGLAKRSREMIEHILEKKGSLRFVFEERHIPALTALRDVVSYDEASPSSAKSKAKFSLADSIIAYDYPDALLFDPASNAQRKTLHVFGSSASHAAFIASRLKDKSIAYAQAHEATRKSIAKFVSIGNFGKHPELLDVYLKSSETVRTNLHEFLTTKDLRNHYSKDLIQKYATLDTEERALAAQLAREHKKFFKTVVTSTSLLSVIDFYRQWPAIKKEMETPPKATKVPDDIYGQMANAAEKITGTDQTDMKSFLHAVGTYSALKTYLGLNGQMTASYEGGRVAIKNLGQPIYEGENDPHAIISHVVKPRGNEKGKVLLTRPATADEQREMYPLPTRRKYRRRRAELSRESSLEGSQIRLSTICMQNRLRPASLSLTRRELIRGNGTSKPLAIKHEFTGVFFKIANRLVPGKPKDLARKLAGQAAPNPKP